MKQIEYPYDGIDSVIDEVMLSDHLNGFTQSGSNEVLSVLNNKGTPIKVVYHQLLSDKIKSQYANLDIRFSAEFQRRMNFKHFSKYTIHPKVNIKNFICSFNGSEHVSRKLLVSILEKFKYYDPEYCSKNFSYSTDIIDGHITNYIPNRDILYRKFFISADSEYFFQTVNSFGHVQFDHTNNIYNLETKLTESFLHIVSETLATSYCPFVTEKFMYSIVTRGLFLSYAQPDWHMHIEKYYGFKLYTKLFDYRFDSIQNPIERLVELITMISKFSKLNYDELYDIYLTELDTINYNYDHYFSGRYLEHLKQYE